MEDKNQQPLVPDMLYRHAMAEITEPEVPVLPLPQDLELSPEGSIPELDASLEDVSAEVIPVEEAPVEEVSAEEMPLPVSEPEAPSTDDLLAALLADHTSVIPEVPVEPEPAPQPATSLEDTILMDWDPEPIAEEVPQESLYQTFAPDSPTQVLPTQPLPEFAEPYQEKPMEESSPVNTKNTASPVRKGRPKRKKGYGLLGIPHLLATILWLAIIVAIGSSLGKLLWVAAADVLAFGRESQKVTVTIVDSDNIDTIAAKLQEAGLVKYPDLFKFYASLTGAEEEITTGTFELDTILDYHALTNALSPSSSSRTVIKVTIPEGYNCRQLFNLLASSNVCSVEALEEYAASGELTDYWFLEGVERGSKYCLEGFLFPDTYEFYVNSTPAEVLNKLLAGFNTRFSEEMQAQIDTLNGRISEMMRANGKSEDYIAANQFTIREIVTVASLVEEETAGTAESAHIASVVYNRLFNWGDNPAYLNFDSTIVYAQEGDAGSINTSIDSPYNTYRNTGLPPTPITNPGLNSIKAALDPTGTAYYYFLYNPETGLHEFTSTYEDHQKLIEELGY